MAKEAKNIKTMTPPDGVPSKHGFPCELNNAGQIVNVFVPEGRTVDKAFPESMFADRASWCRYNALSNQRRAESFMKTSEKWQAEVLAMTDPKAAKLAALRAAQARAAQIEREINELE